MRNTTAITAALLFALSAAACGGDTEEAEIDAVPATPEAAAPAAGTTMPSWMQVDHAARTVTMDVVAGSDATNNSWNFNGYANGNATVVVPEGYTVTLNFSNQDANMAHSIGVAQPATGAFAAIPDVTPVFAGAISSNPTSMTEATLAGESETITFTADAAGSYALICYVPGHATAGMWINFNVVAGEEAGVQAAM